MLIKSFTLGHVQTNCYIITDESTMDCAVIDPGGESNTVLRYLEDNKLHCKCVLLTHGHFDHTGAAEDVHKETGAPIYMHKKDLRRSLTELGYRYAAPKDTLFIKEGDVIAVGGLTIDVIETPGHSEGGLTFRCEDALFTGDTLFRDSCGRTDLPGCDGAEIMKSLKKLYDLPGDFDVYPGHMESTTLERERRFNFFMKEFDTQLK